ncbi:Uncharacterised protein (plasmid) [Citrobacter freundii]|nr:Uncharacterised protein [Citrobacter freundii]
MTLPWRPTMPRRSSLYQREGAAGVRSREKRRRRAWRESPSWSSSERHARGSTHAPSRPARTEQNAVSPSVGAAPSRPIAAPPRAGPPRIATFPITAFSDETRSTESRRRGRVWAAHCPARHTGVRRTPGTEHHASDQPSVREGANGIEQWDARHGHAAHHTRESMRRARARTDRRGHHQPSAR